MSKGVTNLIQGGIIETSVGHRTFGFVEWSRVVSADLGRRILFSKNEI